MKQIDGKFPQLDSFAKNIDGHTWLNVDPANADFVAQRLDDLPGKTDRELPVYVRLDNGVAVRGHDTGRQTATELRLTKSRYDGSTVVMPINRRFLKNALDFGINRIAFDPKDRTPLVGYGNRRTFIIMPLEGDEPKGDANRITVLASNVRRAVPENSPKPVPTPKPGNSRANVKSKRLDGRSLKSWEPLGKQAFVGSTETGDIYEQQIEIKHADGGAMQLRRITIHLYEKTRDGELAVPSRSPSATSPPPPVGRLPFTGVSAQRKVRAGLARVIVTVRKHLTPAWQMPALFAFSPAVLAYNAVSLVRSTLRCVHGEEFVEQKLSWYHLCVETSSVWRGMEVADRRIVGSGVRFGVVEMMSSDRCVTLSEIASWSEEKSGEEIRPCGKARFDRPSSQRAKNKKIATKNSKKSP